MKYLMPWLLQLAVAIIIGFSMLRCGSIPNIPVMLATPDIYGWILQDEYLFDKQM